MMKRLLIFLITLLMFLSVSCAEEETERIFVRDLIESHLYSETLYYKAKYPVIVKGKEYFEYNEYNCLQGFIRLLYVREIVNEVILSKGEDVNTYLANNTDDKTIYIKSIVDEKSIQIYINSNGEVIIHNDSLYITDNNAVDYNEFCHFVKLESVIDEINKNDYDFHFYVKEANKKVFIMKKGMSSRDWYNDELDKISYEEALTKGITKDEYINYYKQKEYCDKYMSLFENDIYVLEIPCLTSGKNNYPIVGTFEKTGVASVPSISYYEVIEDKNIVFNQLGSIIYDLGEEKMYSLSNDALAFKDIDEIANTKNEEINKKVNDFTSSIE